MDFVSSESVVDRAGCGRRERRGWVGGALSLEVGDGFGGIKSGGQRD